LPWACFRTWKPSLPTLFYLLHPIPPTRAFLFASPPHAPSYSLLGITLINISSALLTKSFIYVLPSSITSLQVGILVFLCGRNERHSGNLLYQHWSRPLNFTFSSHSRDVTCSVLRRLCSHSNLHVSRCTIHRPTPSQISLC
jgi:hypothetical protein